LPPTAATDKSGGRFIVQVDSFSEPALYQGRLLSLVPIIFTNRGPCILNYLLVLILYIQAIEQLLIRGVLDGTVWRYLR
jgi:hypothetical protein